MEKAVIVRGGLDIIDFKDLKKGDVYTRDEMPNKLWQADVDAFYAQDTGLWTIEAFSLNEI